MSKPVDIQQAALGTKIIFWFILGALSVFFAEVVSSSDPFPFFHVWGLLVVCPLYTMHILLLLYIVSKCDRMTVNALFIAGMIFGMYEAYITKVLWAPTWCPEWNVVAGGIYVIHTAVLVLFWHPFMAFIVPVLIAESFFTSSREIFAALPQWFQRMLKSTSATRTVVVLFAIYCGIVHGMNSPSAAKSILSYGLSLSVLLALALIWRYLSRGKTLELRSLIPSNREGLVLSLLLAVFYFAMGIFLRPEAMPKAITPHLTVWGIYALLFTLLYSHLKRPRTRNYEMATSVAKGSSLKLVILFGISILASSALLTSAKPLCYIVVVLSWVVGCSVGVAIFVQSLAHTISRLCRTAEFT